jgi:hypothetical protein
VFTTAECDVIFGCTGKGGKDVLDGEIRVFLYFMQRIYNIKIVHNQKLIMISIVQIKYYDTTI